MRKSKRHPFEGVTGRKAPRPLAHAAPRQGTWGPRAQMNSALSEGHQPVCSGQQGALPGGKTSCANTRDVPGKAGRLAPVPLPAPVCSHLPAQMQGYGAFTRDTSCGSLYRLTARRTVPGFPATQHSVPKRRALPSPLP